MATREISIEWQVIREHRKMIVDRITTSAGALWLSQKLQQEDFISSERASAILNPLGIPNCDKVSQMMEAVESKIKYDPSRFFGKFVEIVESEPALKDVHKALNDCYQDKLYVDLEAQPLPHDEEDDTDLEKDLEGQKLLPRREKKDKYDDTDMDENLEGQTLLPRRERKDKYGKSYQQLKTEGVVTIQNSKEKGQPCIQCCVCYSFPVAAVSVVAAMTAAFIALNYNDSDIGRFRRSSEYPEDRKALSTRTVFDFLWITSPTSVMFAVAISTYCTCSRTILKQTHWFHFFNLMAICIYGILMLLFLVWKPLKVDGYFMSLGIPKDLLALLYTVHISALFISAAVFVHPGGIKCWIVMIIASFGALFSSFIAIVYEYMTGLNDAPPSMYRTDAPPSVYMTDSNDAPPLSALNKVVKLYPTLFLVIGIAPTICVEPWFMFQALSLTRIKTLTEAKRYVLFVIILLLYVGYCIYGIYEGFVKGYMTYFNDVPPLSALANFFAIGCGTGAAACVEVWFMFQALSLSRIETLTETKRYVLFVIILLLYTGYCIYGIYEGLVTGLILVFAAMCSFCCSAVFKVIWEL